MNISIPTPARGVTGEAGREAVLPLISIPTPARGVTYQPFTADKVLLISIPTPARGVTAKMHIYPIENLAFLPYFLRNASKNFFLYSRSAKFSHICLSCSAPICQQIMYDSDWRSHRLK